MLDVQILFDRLRPVFCWKNRVNWESWALKCDRKLSSVNLKRSIFILGAFSYLYNINRHSMVQPWVVQCTWSLVISMNVGVKDCSCCRLSSLSSPLIAFHFQQFLKVWSGRYLCGAWYSSGPVLSSTDRVWKFLMSKKNKEGCKTIFSGAWICKYVIFLE